MYNTQTVYVVDDDPAVCESLQALLVAADYWVNTFNSGEAFLRAANRAAGGCILLDVNMPSMNGLQLQESLVREGFDLPVVIVTGQADVQIAVQSLKAGAVDFIEKPYNDKAILQKVEEALEIGEKRASQRQQMQEIESRIDRLTPRESDVLKQLADGNPNKTIARKLGISPRTVEIHRASVMSKMQADNLASLVKMVMATGILASQI